MDYEEDCLDEFPMRNPNLYVTFTDSIESGYILAETGGTISSESNADIISYGA